MSFLINAISFVYGCVVAVKKKLYDWKIFSSYKPKAYTISVGNIVAGGAGKTPCTIFLAELLSKYGPCTVVVRPYKASHENDMSPLQVHKDLTVSICGDEAKLIANRVPSASVWVGNKAQTARFVDESSRYIVVDDGFQHFALQRDCDIVVLDAKNPFGKNRLRREAPTSLSRADLVIVNFKEEVFEFDEEAVRIYTKAPIIYAHYQVDGFFDLHDMPKQVPPGTKVALFSAIADDKPLRACLEKLGLDIVKTLTLNDHEKITNEQLRSLFSEAMICICTEKDRVKLAASDLPICWLKVSLRLSDPDHTLIAQLLQVPL